MSWCMLGVDGQELVWFIRCDALKFTSSDLHLMYPSTPV